MAVNRTLFLIVGTAILLASCVDAYQTRNQPTAKGRYLSSLVESIRSSLRGQASACVLGSSLSCKVAELEADVSELEEWSALVEKKLGPVHVVFDNSIAVQTTLNEVVLLRNVLEASLALAANIPYAGVLFGSAKTAIGFLKTPLEKVKDIVSKIVKSLIKPWDNLLDNTFGKLESLEDLLSSTVSSIGSAASLLEVQCVKPMLRSLVPAVSPTLNALEAVVRSLQSGLRAVVATLKTLFNVLSTSAWQGFQSSVGAVTKGISLISKPFNALSPLTDLLEEPVSVPWLGKFYFKTSRGIPNDCPSGWEKSGLQCFEACPAGYKGIEKLCSSVCPSGYKDVGAACENKYYTSRKVKTLKFNLKGVKCSKSYEKSPDKLFCWKKCDSDYKEHGWLPACYKDCPYGMKIDPTKSKCFKNTKLRASTGVKCGSGKENIAGICYDKCDSGDKDAGLSCFSTTTKSFKISKLSEEISKITDKIEKLGLVSMIKDGIVEAVTAVLQPIMAFLKLPGPNDVPVLNDKLLSTNFLPLQTISNQMEGINPANAIQDIFEFGEKFNEQFDKVRQAFKIPSGLARCTDFQCVTSTIGLKDAPIDAVTNAYAKLASYSSTLANSYATLAGALRGCKDQGETIEIPFLNTLATKLGIKAESCSFSLPFCSMVDVDKAKLSTFMNQVRSVVVEIGGMFGSISPGERRLSGTGVDEWEIPLPRMNLVKVINFDFKASRRAVSFKFAKKDATQQLHGGYAHIKPKLSILPSVGKDKNGTFIKLSFVSEILFRYHSAKSTGSTIRGAYLYLGQRIHNLEDDEKLQHCYGDALSEGEQNTFGAYRRERRCVRGKECSRLCDALDVAYDETKWKWDEASNADFFEKYDSIDESNAWGRPENILIADKMLTFLFKLDSNVTKGATQARTGFASSKAAKVLWAPINFFFNFKAKLNLYKPISVANYFAFKFEETHIGFGPGVSFDLLSGEFRSLSLSLFHTIPKKRPLARTANSLAPSFVVGRKATIAKIYV